MIFFKTKPNYFESCVLQQTVKERDGLDFHFGLTRNVKKEEMFLIIQVSKNCPWFIDTRNRSTLVSINIKYSLELWSFAEFDKKKLDILWGNIGACYVVTLVTSSLVASSCQDGVKIKKKAHMTTFEPSFIKIRGNVISGLLDWFRKDVDTLRSEN